jgi:hypothetical protein
VLLVSAALLAALAHWIGFAPAWSFLDALSALWTGAGTLVLVLLLPVALVAVAVVAWAFLTSLG